MNTIEIRKDPVSRETKVYIKGEPVGSLESFRVDFTDHIRVSLILSSPSVVLTGCGDYEDIFKWEWKAALTEEPKNDAP